MKRVGPIAIAVDVDPTRPSPSGAGEDQSGPAPPPEPMRRLRVLLGVMREFADATTDYEALIGTIAVRCSEVFRCDCVISLLSDDGQALDQVAHRTMDGAIELAFETLSKKVSLRRGIPHPVWTAIDGGRPETFLIDEEHLRSRFDDPKDLAAALALGLHSAAAVPLRVRGVAIGTISLVRTRSNPRLFDDDDVSVALGFADHAALAISNARLLRDAQRELTERRAAEKALREVEEQLRQSQKMDAIGQLAGGVAHDFNNLLSVILGYSTIALENRAVPPEIVRDIQEIHAAAERASQLTRQLLSLSRQTATERRVVGLDEIVKAMSTIIRRVVGEEIRITTRLESDGARVKVDPSHVEQILTNLVVNARDAMVHGGILTITTSTVELDASFAATHLGIVPGPHVRLLVRDSGVGMDDATRSRAFEPFFTTKPVGKGTGLGLSTVFGLVRKNGGTIHVDSVVGAGTTFEIDFPTTTELPAPRFDPLAADLRLSGTETILLVEDEDVVRSLTRTILTRHGYTVLEARDGLDALCVVEDHPETIHLLVTDVVMPEVGGPALASLLAELRPNVPVIYVSGYAPDGPRAWAETVGNAPLITKPFPPKVLLRTVRSVLDSAAVARRSTE